MFGRLYVLVKTLIHGTPQLLLLYTLASVMLGTSCGVLFLAPMKGGFFNPCTLIFYIFGVPFLVVALIKYARARASATQLSLPSGDVLLVVEHVHDVQERNRYLVGVRERTIRFTSQSVVFTPPPSGEQMVPVRCATCQQEIQFRVDSVQQRKLRRSRAVIVAISGAVLAVVLEVVLTQLVQTQLPPDWVFYVSSISALLVVCSFSGIVYLINYIGVLDKRPHVGHQVRSPQREELAHLTSSRSVAAGSNPNV